MLAEVEYWIGSYHGTVSVNADPDDDDERIIALAKKRLRPMPTGLYYERYEVHRSGDRRRPSAARRSSSRRPRRASSRRSRPRGSRRR
jgi:hypothetical protein